MTTTLDLQVRPRESISWDAFLQQTPRASIALDGFVRSEPCFDEATMHANFDHHNGVLREATMSTCRQVFFAIKGNLMHYFSAEGKPQIYVNDCDQDTALALWLLNNHQLFEGTQSIPLVNRLIEITDRLDITGGGFPMNLSESLIRQHNWVFEPYTALRSSGSLAHADATVIRDNLEAVLARITQFMMGQGGERELDTRHEILYASPRGFKIINEIGGNEARYFLFSQGLDAFISLVATRPDGRMVWTVGKRTPYAPFPVSELYDVYNHAEGLSSEDGWNGSNLIGGSSRLHGSRLDHQQLAALTEDHLTKKYGALRPR